ncbi:MAG: hypothetical protein ACK5M4_09580 [Pseudorhodobacter sp.]
MSIELVMGGFYACHQEDHAPVHIWIGEVDLPSDLGRDARQPVASLVVASPEPKAPVMSHAPFWESAAFDGEMTETSPFKVDQGAFREQYAIWRSAWDRGEASAWGLTPNEAYVKMLHDAVRGMKG